MSAKQPVSCSQPTSLRQRDWRSLAFPLALAALCGVLFFWRLGVTPLDDFDESYYAEAAREMLVRGDLLTPYYNGEPFLLKPILIYWLNAAAFRLFGVTEFAVRAVSAFFGTFVVLVTYCFASRALSRRAGLLAGGALALCYMWIDTAREGMIDMPLTAAAAPAMFLLFLAMQAPKGRRKWLYLAAYPLFGIAFLAKGPTAIGVVVLGLVGYLVGARRLGETLREAQLAPGIALALAVAGPWFVYEALHQPGFLEVFFMREHFGHLQGELARDEPWWGHLKNLLVYFYPWIAFLPAAVAHALRQEDRRHVLRFALWWAGAVVVAFSFAGAKLPHYLAPGFPPMAVLVGAWLDAWMNRAAVSRSWVAVGFGLLLVVGFLLAGFAGVAAAMPPAIAGKLAAKFGSWRPGPAPVLMLGALAAGSLGAVACAAARRRSDVAPVLAAAMVVAGLVHVGWFKPHIAEIQAQPRKELAQFVGAAIPESEPLGVFYAKRNATIFYARRPIVDLGEGDPQMLVSFLAEPRPATALTHAKFVPELEAALSEVYVWTRRGDYVLVSNHPLRQLWTRQASEPETGLPDVSESLQRATHLFGDLHLRDIRELGSTGVGIAEVERRRFLPLCKGIEHLLELGRPLRLLADHVVDLARVVLQIVERSQLSTAVEQQQ